MLMKMNGLKYCKNEAIIKRVNEDAADSNIASLNSVPSNDTASRVVYYEMTRASYQELISTYKSHKTFL